MRTRQHIRFAVSITFKPNRYALYFSTPNFPGWITYYHRTGRNVLRHDSPGPDRGTSTNGHSRQNNHMRADERILLDDNWRMHRRMVPKPLKIAGDWMIARNKNTVRSHRYVTANVNLSGEKTACTNPTVGANSYSG